MASSEVKILKSALFSAFFVCVLQAFQTCQKQRAMTYRNVYVYYFVLNREINYGVVALWETPTL